MNHHSSYFFSIVLATSISMGISCTTPTPNASPPGTTLNRTNTLPSNPSTQSPAVIALATVADNDRYFADSELVAGQQSGFSTKLIGLDQTVATELENKGTIVTGADGSVKVDVQKATQVTSALTAQLQADLQASSQTLMAVIASVKASLDVKLDVSASVKAQLSLNSMAVKASQSTSTTNADGSVAKLVAVSFENQNRNTVRENVVVRTYASDGRVLKVEHSLNITLNGSAVNRTATRLIIINTDGSRTVKTKTQCRLNSGATLAAFEERNIDTQGSGSGQGSLTVVSSTGASTSYMLNSKVQSSTTAMLTATQTSSQNLQSVTLTQQAQGSATVETVANGQSSKSNLNLESATELNAS